MKRITKRNWLPSVVKHLLHRRTYITDQLDCYPIDKRYGVGRKTFNNQLAEIEALIKYLNNNGKSIH